MQNESDDDGQVFKERKFIASSNNYYTQNWCCSLKLQEKRKETTASTSDDRTKIDPNWRDYYKFDWHAIAFLFKIKYVLNATACSFQNELNKKIIKMAFEDDLNENAIIIISICTVKKRLLLKKKWLLQVWKRHKKYKETSN